MGYGKTDKLGKGEGELGVKAEKKKKAVTMPKIKRKNRTEKIFGKIQMA